MHWKWFNYHKYPKIKYNLIEYNHKCLLGKTYDFVGNFIISDRK